MSHVLSEELAVLDAPSELTIEVEPPPSVRSRRAARVLRGTGWALGGAALFCLAWALAASRSADLPSPAETLTRLRELLADPFYDRGPNDKGIGTQLLVSLQRVGTGFAFATVVGIPMGLLIGASKRAWQAFNPIVQVLRPVSPLAWFPLWLAMSHDAPRASVIVIFITALWPVVIGTAAGAAEIPSEQRDVARVFRFSHLAYVRHVLVPNALPSVITGLRLSMGTAWMVIVAVEMLSGSTGIGFFVWDSYNTGNLATVASAILVIGVTGFVIDAGFVRLSRRFAVEVRS